MTLLSVAIATVWAIAFWIMSRDRSDTLAIALIGAAASMIAVAFAASAIWPQVLAGYPNDSYWTLDWGGSAGVASIAATGIAALFTVLTVKSRIIMRWKQQATNTAWVIIDVALGLTLFAMLYSVSPQAFYTLYRMIIPDLPQQWVIDGVFDLPRLKVVAELQTGGNLSDHLAGITLWSIVPFTLWLHLRDWWRGGA